MIGLMCDVVDDLDFGNLLFVFFPESGHDFLRRNIFVVNDDVDLQSNRSLVDNFFDISLNLIENRRRMLFKFRKKLVFLISVTEDACVRNYHTHDYRRNNRTIQFFLLCWFAFTCVFICMCLHSFSYSVLVILCNFAIQSRVFSEFPSKRSDASLARMFITVKSSNV